MIPAQHHDTRPQMPHRPPYAEQVTKCDPSSPSLEPSSCSQHGDALIHDPFTHSQVAVDPFLELFAFRYLFRVDAGAKVPLGRVVSAYGFLCTISQGGCYERLGYIDEGSSRDKEGFGIR